MTCKDIQSEMDRAFDEALEWPAAVERHVVSCGPCRAYQSQLEGLDAALSDAPRVAPDPALAARIQATIATRPVYTGLPWGHAAGIGAAVVLLSVAGWFVDTGRIFSSLLRIRWMPEGSWLPEAYVMKIEIDMIPAALREGLLMALGGISEAWNQGSRALSGFTGGDSSWIWIGFVACLVLAVALNGREIVSRPDGRSRTSNG